MSGLSFWQKTVTHPSVVPNFCVVGFVKGMEEWKNMLSFA
jgi:hypothetical protein